MYTSLSLCPTSALDHSLLLHLSASFSLTPSYIFAYEMLRAHSAEHVASEPLRNFIAGAVASLVSQTILVPADVISQRMMVQGRSMVRVGSCPEDRLAHVIARV